jgi:hypothetical protein
MVSKYIVDDSGNRQAYTIEADEIPKLFEIVEANENTLSTYKRLSDETLWLSVISDTKATMIPMMDSPHPM